MLPYLIAGVIGYGISKLFEGNKAPKYNDGGLVAPNGKPSNLTPEQYKLVRTKAFKDWFGDWENDPENASKVVDSNGEPLVVYHGTASIFNEFRVGRTNGLFFTNKKESANRFSSGDLRRVGDSPRILECFLKINKLYNKNTNDEILVNNYYQDYFEKRPFISKSSQKNILKNKYNRYFMDLVSFGIVNEEPKQKLISYNYEGIIIDADNNSKSYIVFEPNQIKLADGTNTTFDSNNPDIRFMAGGELTNNDVLKNFVNQVEAYQSNHYGTFNRDNLVESYHKLPDSIKENIKPISTKNLFRGADGTSYKSAISFTKNQDYARMFGAYAFPFKVVKENKGLIDTKRLSALLRKMRIANEIGDDEGEVIVIEPIFSKDIIENIEKFRFDNGGLIAPNGKPSNLTPEQYKLVRSESFKKWFGDWENDPENASKVVDENGEPLVVWRGESKDFNVFEYKKLGSTLKTAWRNAGFYFSPTKQGAEQYMYFYAKGILKQFFLNLKNPYTLDSKEFIGVMDWGSLPTQRFKTNKSATDFATKRISEIKSANYDGAFVTILENNNVVEIVAFEPNQIKLADGSNTTFDSNNPDIRFMAGGITQPRDLTQIVNYQNIYKGADYYSYSDNLEKQEKADRWFDLFITNQKERQLTAQEFSEFMQLSNELAWEDLD